MTAVWDAIFQAGFFSSDEVQVALVVGGVVAVVSGVVGVFAVLRGQSFAGHALADVGSTGGSGAFLVGAPPMWGFLVFSVAGAALMELIGIQRARGRDLATGIVLGGALGLSALFLYEDTTVHNTTGATMTVLFGSIFAISSSLTPWVVALSAISTAGVIVCYRPLLLASVHPDLAAAAGVPVRQIGAVFLGSLSVAVALSSITIGSILSTALLIGPAATAVRLARRPGLAMLWSALIAVVSVWLGVLLAYDSYTWPPKHQAWPASFFVVAVVFLFYLGADAGVSLRARLRRPAAGQVAGDGPAPAGVSG
ncbi:metal ABC transporter permease [Flexivirga caeni]|uniref:Metal ABC transporter permease n=1 Tax=Flexivirga caeni TaxID=2294115 RepID=A0A3M9MEH2_9MICO|nr:metal ABC transporter permease [Flexivirga caeni]RNI23961.1 metal ABC transporter permease [Flexivirga caeni]